MNKFYRVLQLAAKLLFLEKLLCPPHTTIVEEDIFLGLQIPLALTLMLSCVHDFHGCNIGNYGDLVRI